jgi:chromosome segregation ATPase
MLKFDEVEAESRKAQGLNGTLNTELAAEREKANATIKQIETLGRQEERLKEQKVQLERRLAEANDRVRDQNTDKSTLQKDAEDLRQQLKLAEDECREAKVAIERLEKKMQKRDKRVADFEVSWSISPHNVSADDEQKSIEILRDDNNKLAEAVKNHKVIQSTSCICNY